MSKNNSYQKGNKYELEVVKILEKQGYQIFRQHRKAMFIKEKMIMVGCDIFGCDIVAKKHWEKPLWIQVSTIKNKTNKIKQVKKFIWNGDYETVEIWCRLEGKKVYEVYRGPSWDKIREEASNG